MRNERTRKLAYQFLRGQVKLENGKLTTSEPVNEPKMYQFLRGQVKQAQKTRKKPPTAVLGVYQFLRGQVKPAAIGAAVSDFKVTLERINSLEDR